MSEAEILAICEGDGIKRMAPQGPVFHWKDGWMFCRGEANAVHIWCKGIELKIPAAEWDSITRHLDGKLP